MAESETSKSAKILYRPVGLISSTVGGLLAGIVLKQVWRQAAPDEQSHAPTALDKQYPLKEILFAAAVEGVIYSVVKTVIDRGGAHLFERWTGKWPGS
jgi:hypothetical protein